MEQKDTANPQDMISYSKEDNYQDYINYDFNYNANEEEKTQLSKVQVKQNEYQQKKFAKLDPYNTPQQYKNALKDNLNEIEDRQVEDFDSFFVQFSDSIDQINNLANSLKFKASGSKPQLLIFGEMGNGKSTTGNYLIRETLSLQEKKPKQSQQFEAQKSLVAVTKAVNILKFENISYIDTPGFNDPDKSRSDNQNFQEIVNQIYKIADTVGIASVLQCVMVPESGRINASAYQLMSKMLQTFTLSYPDRPSLQGPKIQVLFTNLSKNQYDDDEQYQNISLQSESDEDKNDDNQKDEKRQKESEISEVNFDNLVIQFRDNMCQQLVKDQQLNQQEAKKIINQLFPDKSFFAFKLFSKKESDKMKQELKEINRINREAIDQGNFRIINSENSHLLPVVMSNDCRDQIITQIQEMLSFCENQIKKAIKNYQNFSSGKKNQELNNIGDKIEEIIKKFKLTIKQKPYCILKADPESLKIINSLQKKFTLYCSMFAQKQVAKFNQEEAKILKKELQKLKDQQRKKDEEIDRLIYQNEERFRSYQEQFEERQQKRRERAYNEKYSNKQCWACNQYGHLIYWCPDYQKNTNYQWIR